MIADQGSSLLGKVASLSLLWANALTPPSINQISVPLLGAPLTAVTMAAAGVACSFAWPQSKESTRGRLFFIALASTIAGASAVSVVPQWLGMAWPRELQPPLAFFFGMVAPRVIPATFPLIPTFFKALSNTLVRMMASKVGGTKNGDDDVA